MIPGAFAPKYERVICFTQLGRGLDQRIEHNLEIEGRPTDDLKDVGGRGLLLERFTQLIEQPRVLDCDDSLGGEILQQLDLLVGERPNLPTIDIKGTNDRAVFKHWHRDQRAYTGNFYRSHCQRVAVGIGTILFEIDYLDRLASVKGPGRWHRRTRPKQSTDVPSVAKRFR